MHIKWYINTYTIKSCFNYNIMRERTMKQNSPKKINVFQSMKIFVNVSTRQLRSICTYFYLFLGLY